MFPYNEFSIISSVAEKIVVPCCPDLPVAANVQNAVGVVAVRVVVRLFRGPREKPPF